MGVKTALGLTCLGAALQAGAPASAAPPGKPILFVTQVPMPEEVNSRTVSVSYQSCVSPFSNHLGDTAHCGRGGSLHERFPDGQVVDLLALADWSAVGAKPASGAVAVRRPSVGWDADRAIFSMVVGVPSGPSDATTFTWQLYEITLPTQAQLGAGTKPVLTKVANQPAYDNVDPVYALDGRIVFASAAPYNGAPHLTQREEYLGLPTVSGLWSLDPSDASSLMLLHHAPSGAFAPTIDAAGRIVFASWDHLARDSEAVTDSRAPVTGAPYNETTWTQTFNGSGNFDDESAAAAFTDVTAMAPETWDVFPEPRNFDHVTLIDVYANALNGNAQNIFLPWSIGLDGTGGEILNHVGRQEVAAGVTRSFKNDAALIDLVAAVAPGYGGLVAHRFFNNFMAPREDPTTPGRFYGVDAADLGTHGAGQIVRLENAGVLPDGTPQNPDGITVTYITGGANGAAKPAFIPTVKPGMDVPPTGQSPLSAANAETLYRTPLPCSDGALVASRVSGVTQMDYNTGTRAQPVSFFAFRLVSLKPSGATMVLDQMLTTGITLDVSYYVGATLVSYSGPAWELDPVEVVARQRPVVTTPGGPAASALDPIEAGVFAAAGVDVATFQAYLKDHDAALTVSRDVTQRDYHDRQQPFDLRVSGTSKQTTSGNGKVYDVAWMQVLEADLRRGYRMGGASPAPGRRAVATPMHQTWDENVQASGAPAGAVRVAADGSVAAVVPAGKALTWHLLDDDQAKTSQVKERFWVTFQRGEIRTCPNCHGINTWDQTGAAGRPTNPPEALSELLVQWKSRYPAGVMGLATDGLTAAWDAGQVTIDATRTSGETGPVSVDWSLSDGSATKGVDYVAASGTLQWDDGDVANKTITIGLVGTRFEGADRTFTLTLSHPQYGSLGGVTSATVTLTGAAPEADPEPVVESSPEPEVEVEVEVEVEPEVEPVVESSPEPEVEVEVEVEPEVESSPEVQPDTAPVIETSPEPVAESSPEPTVEPGPEDASEVTISDKSKDDGCSGGGLPEGLATALLAALTTLARPRARQSRSRSSGG